MKYSVKDIEKIIYKYLPKEDGYADMCIEAMNYAYKVGGKRLRPMMMKLCYDMYAENEDETVEYFMSAIEMIHTYSLIHDDLPALDNDDLRRGKPTVHKAYREDIAILAGDGLLNFAFETAVKAFDVRPGNIACEKAISLLTRKPGIYGMIGGQTLDVIKSGEKITEDELKYIYENKTSALIECSMMIGAILGGANTSDIDKIEKIGSLVGMAFQVQDDILDIEGDQAVIGKPVHSDEKNDKYTYATIYGMDKAKKYVSDKSKEAKELLDSLTVNHEEAKLELEKLIMSLITRDR